MRVENRLKMLRAMETIARCVNDELILDGWLTNGVADGDITGEETDDSLLDYVLDDDTYQDTIECFLRTMRRAANRGGITHDRVSTRLAAVKAKIMTKEDME